MTLGWRALFESEIDIRGHVCIKERPGTRGRKEDEGCENRSRQEATMRPSSVSAHSLRVYPERSAWQRFRRKKTRMTPVNLGYN